MIANRVLFSRAHGPKVAVLSLLVHVLAVVIAWCVVQSIAAPVLFGQVFQLVPPVMLITMLPISIAGWGVREATMGLAFGYAGLMASEGVNISLLFGAVSFIVGLVGGLVWILSAEKAAQGTAPIAGSQIIPRSNFPRGSNGQFAPPAVVGRRSAGGAAVGRADMGDPAAADANSAGKAERAFLAPDSDAAGRRHRGDRGRR